MSKTDGKIPSWALVTIFILVAAFVGFLFFLSTVPAGNDGAAVKGNMQDALQATIDKAKQDASKLVEEVKPTYEFYEELEKQTVDVSKLNDYISTPKDAEIKYEYILQVESLRSAEAAESKRAQFILEGLDSYVQAVEVDGRKWHRVYVGPYADRSKLNRAQDRLADLNLSPIVITKKVN